MIRRKPLEASEKWSWDEAPVRPLAMTKFAPAWWSRVASDTGASEYQSAVQDRPASAGAADRVAHGLGSAWLTYHDFLDLHESEVAAVHNCATAYHQRRSRCFQSARGGHALQTPLFHGRTPPAAFLVEKFIAERNRTGGANRDAALARKRVSGRGGRLPGN